MQRYAYASGLLAATTTLFGHVAAEPSIAVAYCASLNTASTGANSSTYQSEGLCYDYCNDDGYALGVLQDKDCWCSNYVPTESDQVDTSECDTSCPGYPDDYCGGDGLYGYIQLSASVSGTSGGDSTTATSTSTTSSTISPTTSTKVETSIRVETETETETVQDSVTTSSTSNDLTTSTSLTSTKTTSETTSSSLKTTTTAKTTSTSTTSSDDTSNTSTSDDQNQQTKTTITSVQTVTSAGTVIVQTVTTVADTANNGGGGLSKGAIAGLVIGILAAIAAFVAGAILYRRHKKNQELQEQTPLSGAAHRRGSSAGIMSKTGTMSSSGYGFDMMEDNGYGSPGRRMSMKPMDPRLDPKHAYGLYRAASHDSINTLRDDQDYSRRVHEPPRTLRVTNADPGDD